MSSPDPEPPDHQFVQGLLYVSVTPSGVDEPEEPELDDLLISHQNPTKPHSRSETSLSSSSTSYSFDSEFFEQGPLGPLKVTHRTTSDPFLRPTPYPYHPAGQGSQSESEEVKWRMGHQHHHDPASGDEGSEPGKLTSLELATQNEELRLQLNRLNSNCELLEKQKHSMEEAYNEIHAHNVQLEEKVKEVKNGNGKKDELMTRELDTLKSSVETLDGRIKYFKRKLEASERKSTKLDEENKQLEAELNSTRAEAEHAQAQVKKFESERRTLEIELYDKSEQVSVLEVKSHDLETQLKELQEYTNSVSKDYQNLKQEKLELEQRRHLDLQNSLQLQLAEKSLLGTSSFVDPELMGEDEELTQPSEFQAQILCHSTPAHGCGDPINNRSSISLQAEVTSVLLDPERGGLIDLQLPLFSNFPLEQKDEETQTDPPPQPDLDSSEDLELSNNSSYSKFAEKLRIWLNMMDAHCRRLSTMDISGDLEIKDQGEWGSSPAQELMNQLQKIVQNPELEHKEKPEAIKVTMVDGSTNTDSDGFWTLEGQAQRSTESHLELQSPPIPIPSLQQNFNWERFGVLFSLGITVALVLFTLFTPKTGYNICDTNFFENFARDFGVLKHEGTPRF